MANFDSDLYTLEVAAAADFSAAPNAHDYGGPVLVKTGKVTLTGSTATNDVLRLFYLPENARVIPCQSFVQCSGDPGTTLTLDIGTTDNEDGFADGIVLSAGGCISFASTVCAQSTTPARLSDRLLVSALVASADTITNATTLTFWIAYTL